MLKKVRKCWKIIKSYSKKNFLSTSGKFRCIWRPARKRLDHSGAPGKLFDDLYVYMYIYIMLPFSYSVYLVSSHLKNKKTAWTKLVKSSWPAKSSPGAWSSTCGASIFLQSGEVITSWNLSYWMKLGILCSIIFVGIAILHLQPFDSCICASLCSCAQQLAGDIEGAHGCETKLEQRTSVATPYYRTINCFTLQSIQRWLTHVSIQMIRNRSCWTMLDMTVYWTNHLKQADQQLASWGHMDGSSYNPTTRGFKQLILCWQLQQKFLFIVTKMNTVVGPDQH